MEWKNLSKESKAILERCWNLRNDDPDTFSVQLEKPFEVLEYSLTPTEDTYNEIFRYQRHHKEFSLIRTGDIITVRGLCKFGSWDDKK